MKRYWHVVRTTTPHPNAQQRWDHAYHLLLRWASPNPPSWGRSTRPQLSAQQEDCHARSAVCPRLDDPSSPTPDD